MADIPLGFLKLLVQGIATIKIRRSALAPFLMACFFITVPSWVIAAYLPEPLRYWVVGLGAIPLILFAVASLFLLFWDRDRLHTEEHLERKRALEIVETKGKRMLIEADDLVDMVNPHPEVAKIPAPSRHTEVSNG